MACAASIAAIDFMLENEFAKEAKEKGKYLIEKFFGRKFDRVREVRNLGLMVGIELKEKSKPYIQKLMESGVLTLPAGATVISLLPPLTISYEEIDFVVEKLFEVLS